MCHAAPTFHFGNSPCAWFRGCFHQCSSCQRTLTSTAVPLEFDTNPFSYRVTERSTGDLLDAQTGATLFTDNKYTVRNASDFVKTSTNLHAILHLEGTSEPAQVSFTFLTPEVLQVVLTFKNGVPATIREEFTSEFNYFTGNAVEKIVASRNGDTLTIQFGDLGVNASPEIYCRKPKEVTRTGAGLREGRDYRYDVRAQSLTIPVRGPAKVTLTGAGNLF